MTAPRPITPRPTQPTQPRPGTPSPMDPGQRPPNRFRPPADATLLAGMADCLRAWGAACPSPFEDTGIDDLTLVESLAALQSHLESRNQPEYGQDRGGEIVDLLGRAREAGLR